MATRRISINPDDYVTEQVFYSSKSASRIPMFIVHRRDVKPSGDAQPSTGDTVALESRSTWASTPTPSHGWIAVASTPKREIRGGGDYGEDWHRAGMRAGKQNTIERLHRGRRGSHQMEMNRPDRIMACGASNGGLLVGAAIIQRPELFAAAYITAPLLDMVRYPLFGNGKQYIDEYGSPDDATALRALLSYSPYHNVKHGVRYPSTLVYTSDGDIA